MKSGGTAIGTLELNKLTDTNSNNIKGDTDAEVNAAVVDSNGSAVQAASLTDDAEVKFGDDVYKWKDLKAAVESAARSHGTAAANLSPEEVKTKLPTMLLNDVNETTNALKTGKDQLAALEQKLSTTTLAAQKRAIQTQIDNKRDELVKTQDALRKLITQAKTVGVTDSQLSNALKAIGEPIESNSAGNTGFGEARASYTNSTPPGPSGGQNYGAQNGNGGGARASTLGGNGFGAGLFDGMSTPSSAAYMNALAMDSQISQALNSISDKTVEGQKLMMLFFYYAKMAESGDLGAMYQFIKFINYIIAKDKSKQNVEISTKLIDLQQQSQQANDILMNADSSGTDNASQNDFMKKLQTTKSQQDSIATSQKLLSDMLQEFAQVVETLGNSVKNMLDAWGRVQRNASAR